MQKASAFFYLIFISACTNSISNMDLSDIEGHRVFQNEQWDRAGSFNDRFSLVRKQISEYRLIESSKPSKYIYYYLARLYNRVALDKESIDSIWYDHQAYKIRDEITYKNFVDSTFFYIDRAVNEDSTNLYALSLYIGTIQAAQSLPLNIKGIYSYFDKRTEELFGRVENVIPFTDKILLADTTKDRNLSIKSIIASLQVIDYKLSTFKSLDIEDVNTKALISKLDNYLAKFNGIKHLCPYPELLKIPIEYENKYAKQIADLNVTVEVYKNMGCDWLWIYSNGKYKQELWEMDTESIPYDERMRLTTYDLLDCSYPNAKVYVKRRSEGTYKISGDYYYFYAKSGSPDIMVGYDYEKRVHYVRRDRYGNLTWINPTTYEDMSYNRAQ